MNVLERFRKHTLANQASVVFGAVVTIATVGSVVNSILQYKIAKINAAENSAQTAQLINAGNINAIASQRNAAAAENFASTAQAINSAMESAVGKLDAQATATESLFEADSRPYLGVDSIPVHRYADTGWVSFPVVLKNYGTIPAYNVTFDRKTLINGELHLSAIRMPDLPQILPPNNTMEMTAAIPMSEFDPVFVVNRTPLDVYVRYSYTWRNHRESYCLKEHYEPVPNAFMNLGPMCGRWEDIGKPPAK